MSRRTAILPVAAALLAVTVVAHGSSASAAPAAVSRPTTSCATLHQREQRDYDIYQEDAHKYGKKSEKTQKAFDTYEEAHYEYVKQC